MWDALTIGQKMNGLRTASYVGLGTGIIISFVGGALGSAIYGCVPPANVTCNPSPSPEDIIGGYLFYSGVVLIIASLVVLVISWNVNPRYPSSPTKTA